MSLTLLPTVDIADGQAVRLVQDAVGTETSCGTPLGAATNWQNAGAERIHLVDLDVAFGRGSNYGPLADAMGKLDVKAELSGGVRDNTSLEAVLTTGCARVSVGTTVLESPEWRREVIASYDNCVAIGLDVLNDEGQWHLRGRGWVFDSGDLWEVLEHLNAQGASRFVVIDVSKDDTLQGPNVRLLHEVAVATDAPIATSGGASSLDDITAIAALADEGTNSAIVGKASYAGRFTSEEALAAARD